MELLKTGFLNGKQLWRRAKIVGKNGFSTYFFDFFGIFCDKILWFRKHSSILLDGMTVNSVYIILVIFIPVVVNNDVQLRWYTGDKP